MNYSRTYMLFLSVVTCLSFACGSSALAKTLAYWRFEEAQGINASITQSGDHSGHQVHLKQDSAINMPVSLDKVPSPFMDDKQQVANHFSMQLVPGRSAGEGDYLQTSDHTYLNFKANEPFTIEGWINPHTYGQAKATRHIVFKRDKTSTGYALFLNAQGLLEFRIAASVRKQAAVRSTAPIPLDQWTHFAVTRQTDGRIHLYLDGSHIAQGKTLLPDSLENTGKLIIGDHGMVANPDFAFDGMLDEIRISDTALKPESFLNHHLDQHVSRQTPVDRIDIASLGAIPDDGKDDTQAFLTAVKNFGNSANIHLVLAKGQYDIDADQLPEGKHLILLRDRQSITIEGNEALLCFHGSARPLTFWESQNIRIENLLIDWDKPPFSEGQIMAMGSNSMDIMVDKKYPIDANIQVAGIMDYDPLTRHPLGYIDTFDSAIASVTVIKPQVIRITYTRSRPLTRPVGSPVVIRHTVYGFNAIEMHHCRDIALSSVTVHTAPGMALMAGMCQDITLDDFQIRPSHNRLMSTTADGTMFSSCSGKIDIQNSHYQAMGDDGINVWTKYMTIRAIPRSDQLVIAARKGWRGPLPIAGGQVELVTPDTLLTYQTLMVKAAQYDPSQKAYIVTFNQTISNQVKVGDLACDISRLAKLHVRNTHFPGNRARAILVSTHDALIENCTFANQTLSGISIYADPVRNSQQGSSSRQVVIRNNQFNGTAAAAIFAYAQAPTPTPGVHQHITISNNHFKRNPQLDALRHRSEKDDLQYWQNAIYLGSSSNVHITGNQFSGYDDALFVHASDSVDITDNQSDHPASITFESTPSVPTCQNNSNLTCQKASAKMSAAYRIFDQR